jgi:transcriptional regulator NrdR family protein
MKCPGLSCNSHDVTSQRKYKTTSDINRKKYSGMNIDRRRYTCNTCGRSFHTIEQIEEDFEKNQITNPLTELSSRVR